MHQHLISGMSSSKVKAGFLYQYAKREGRFCGHGTGKGTGERQFNSKLKQWWMTNLRHIARDNGGAPERRKYWWNYEEKTYLTLNSAIGA